MSQRIQALQNKRLFCTVVDLFVIPDYTAFLEPFIDGKFGRYAKLEWTQLEFTFEAVEVSEFFPLGVKMTYRPFCQDEVIRIVKDHQSPAGIQYICI